MAGERFFRGVADVDENQAGVWVNALLGTLRTWIQNSRGEAVHKTGYAVTGADCYGEQVAKMGISYDLERKPIEKMPWKRRRVARPEAALDAQQRARG